MLRNALESVTGNLSDEEYYLALDLATDDIKVNRLAWHKRTGLNDLIQIVKVCVIVLTQIKRAAS